MNDEVDDRFEVVLLGRNLGTATGWDDGPAGELIWFYGFKPREGINLPKCILRVNFTTGMIGVQDEMTEMTHMLDIVSFLQSVPRA